MKKKGLLFFLVLGIVNSVQSTAMAATKAKASVSPVSKASELNLNDLGFGKDEFKIDPEQQKIFEKRSNMLQTHQILGLVTLGLMTATYFTSRGGQEATAAHQILGYTTAASYFTTAYFALNAPETEGITETGWNMKFHRAMVFIHFPGMILTPIAGYLANKAYKNGKKPTGLASYKGAIASATYFSFAAAALSVTINF